MIEEGSKTPVIIGIILGVICAFACLLGGVFVLFGIRLPSPPPPPVVAAPGATLMVALAADGGVYVDGVSVAPADLGTDLVARFHTEGDARVQIAADKSLPHAEVVRVMDEVKKAGYTRMSLMVAPP